MVTYMGGWVLRVRTFQRVVERRHMPRDCRRVAVRCGAPILLVTALSMAASGCAMAGFGGALQLNITDRQTRQLTIEIDGGGADARIFEVGMEDEVELGTGSATIDRYLLHRAAFGSSVAVGYFLCPKPCNDPLNDYLAAYSPDQIFNADGGLELRFRILSDDGISEDITRTINPEMLPALWQNPRIAAGSG